MELAVTQVVNVASVESAVPSVRSCCCGGGVSCHGAIWSGVGVSHAGHRAIAGVKHVPRREKSLGSHPKDAACSLSFSSLCPRHGAALKTSTSPHAIQSVVESTENTPLQFNLGGPRRGRTCGTASNPVHDPPTSTPSFPTVHHVLPCRSCREAGGSLRFLAGTYAGSRCCPTHCPGQVSTARPPSDAPVGWHNCAARSAREVRSARARVTPRRRCGWQRAGAVCGCDVACCDGGSRGCAFS